MMQKALSPAVGTHSFLWLWIALLVFSLLVVLLLWMRSRNVFKEEEAKPAAPTASAKPRQKKIKKNYGHKK